MFQAQNPLQFTLAALAFCLTLHAQTVDPVRHFIEALTIPSEANPSADPVFEKELMALAGLIPTAPPEQITGYLPQAGSVLAKGGPGQRGAVMMLMFQTARRPDAAVLLKPYLPQILASLRDPAPGMVTFASYILINLFPQPVDTVVPYLVDYVKDDQVEELSRAGGVSILVWYAPNDPAVIAAITGFLQAKHAAKTRAETLKGMGLMMSDSHGYNPELIGLIVDAVRNDRETRNESIPALGRCGWMLQSVASPLLEGVAADENESAAIRAAARAAIDDMLHSPRIQTLAVP